MKKVWCVYRITNLVDGKPYIGQHKYKCGIKDPLIYYNGSGILLKKAIAKYGIDNFKKEVLYSNIQLQETANSIEKLAIIKERQLNKHGVYNLSDGGQDGRYASREKLSAAAKRKYERLRKLGKSCKPREVYTKRLDLIWDKWVQFNLSSYCGPMYIKTSNETSKSNYLYSYWTNWTKFYICRKGYGYDISHYKRGKHNGK